MGLPVQRAGPDLAMLFLGMKLVTMRPEDSACAGVYGMAKDFISSLERNGALSLLVLQAMVLVGLYEYGHGIYPAAWMTTGACARYAEALGLSAGEYSLLGKIVWHLASMASYSDGLILFRQPGRKGRREDESGGASLCLTKLSL